MRSLDNLFRVLIIGDPGYTDDETFNILLSVPFGDDDIDLKPDDVLYIIGYDQHLDILTEQFCKKNKIKYLYAPEMLENESQIQDVLNSVDQIIGCWNGESNVIEKLMIENGEKNRKRLNIFKFNPNR